MPYAPILPHSFKPSYPESKGDAKGAGEPKATDKKATKYNKKTHKKCIKCRLILERVVFFGKHDTASDGFQSICKTCKGAANKKAREKNVGSRLRHHIATRCLDQLGREAPKGLTRELEDYLGYSIRKLVRHLRQDLREREGEDRKLLSALNEGYHVDHIRPLSSYKVIIEGEDGVPRVDWDEFKRCWTVENLSAIPAAENLAKSNKWDATDE